MKKTIFSFLSLMAFMVSQPVQALVAAPAVGDIDVYQTGELSPAFAMGSLVFQLVILAIAIVTGWKIFTKAGKPGWATLIPVYNTIVTLEIVKKPVWWLLLMFIPVVNIVIAIMIAHRISLSFGKGIGFTVGLILLPPVFGLILAFGDAKYTPLQD